MIIALSGKIGSGKTTIAQSLASALTWRYLSIGNYIRFIALEEGMDATSRKVLQDLGQKTLQHQGWTAFIKGFLVWGNYQSGESIVVDGVRFREAVSTLSELTGSKVLLVHLYLDEDTRKKRIIKRDGNYDPSIDNHANESESSKNLVLASDLTINSEGDPAKVTTQIIDHIFK